MNLTLDYRDGAIVMLWRGERIGHLEYRGSGCVSGVAVYGTECFSTDDTSEDGVPLHWIEPKVTEMCERVDSQRSAA